jgi:hypothetical protein
MDLTDFNGREIRLSDERWGHINKRHPETAGQEGLVELTVSAPDYVQEGAKGERLAIKKFAKTPVSVNKYCVVVYNETKGFVITAYFTRRPSFRRKLLWKK